MPITSRTRLKVRLKARIFQGEVCILDSTFFRIQGSNGDQKKFDLGMLLVDQQHRILIWYGSTEQTIGMPGRFLSFGHIMEQTKGG
jgi:hypothetical protein